MKQIHIPLPSSSLKCQRGREHINIDVPVRIRVHRAHSTRVCVVVSFDYFPFPLLNLFGVCTHLKRVTCLLYMSYHTCPSKNGFVTTILH